MNQKEINEIRRRLKPDKSTISHICGCYVNANKEIISDLDEPLGLMAEEEAEKYLGLLKKTLSGSLGKNLIDMVFSTEQVSESPEHHLLTALRDSGLKDGAVRREFYQKVIETLEMEDCNYLILLAHDTYDVPYRGKDDRLQAEASDSVFSYLLCCVCPVKAGKPALSYSPEENQFFGYASGPVVAPPELGFMFPAFDDRAANIYNALFYSKNPLNIHHEFIDAVFNTEPPLTVAEQREAFQSALSQALEEECSFDLVQWVYGQLRDTIEQHRESKDPEPLEITVQELGGILKDYGATEELATAFQKKYDELQGGVILPENIIDSKRFEVSTTDATISVAADRSYLLEARSIDGRPYILVPADQGLEINGFAVKVAKKEEILL